MVQLIEKTKINALNIDTVERALVLASLALRLAIAASGEPEDLIGKIKITTQTSGQSNVSLRLDATLPLDAENFTDKGGSILDSINSLPTNLTILTGKLNFTTTPSSPSEPTIPDYDETVINTFEKYLVYYALILSASLPDNRNEVITITPQINNFDGAEIRIRVTLPLNNQGWTLGKNFIDSIGRVTDSYQASFTFEIPSNEVSLLTDDILLTDDLLLTD